ncbi:glucan endo-1,3-beta-glucosidase 11-like [Zingiber officinale]|uniref:glucan endo-1,3-beta-glucosidase 11-like n=1 Tax=Zingiber officinale TaxID=94328 RepID=UPI001C4A94AE|nr:glucan endo-1,3-beta-glucosidase 11-like [Zingiber officinale]
MSDSMFFKSRMVLTVAMLTSIFSSDFGLFRLGSSLGINYGQVANNLPSPEQVLMLLKSLKVNNTRIYDTNPQVLTAFANTGIDIIVMVPNEAIRQLMDPQLALQWVADNVQPYFPATKITGIAVGNEVFTSDDAAAMSDLAPAMASIRAALVQIGLGDQIHVSSANSLAVLESSYPPSSGAFKAELAGTMAPFLQFLAATKAPFWVNAYPYFAYKDDPSGIPLDYVLFNPNGGMEDPQTQLRYDNMLYAQVDAAIFALERLGYGGVEVRVAETGWPSKGDADEVGASTENARLYNRNLLVRQMANEGTPRVPNRRLEVYLFAMFNEDLKPGPTSERNYGLFHPDGTMAYNLGLAAPLSASSTASLSLTSSAAKETSRIFGCHWSCITVVLLLFSWTVQVKL